MYLKKGMYICVEVSKFEYFIIYCRYTANYTTEIFKIYAINSLSPESYKLVDYQNKKISGEFLPQLIKFVLYYIYYYIISHSI